MSSSSKVIWSHAACRRPELFQILADSTVGVCIGNFDGVHLGHLEIFKVLSERLDALSAAQYRPAVKVLLTFFPHPRRVFGRVDRTGHTSDKFLYLTPLRTKLSILEQLDFDILVTQKFDSSFRNLTPQQFISDVLGDSLKASLVVVGQDWAFGRARTGGIELLKASPDFEVCVVPHLTVSGEKISSTILRDALQRGDFEVYRAQTGRSFFVDGKVIKGCQLGRQLGFPTANLLVADQLLPPEGVYSGWAEIGGRKLAAAISLGRKPVFGDANPLVLEAHFLTRDWLELYGERLRLNFVAKLRDQRKYASREELIAGIGADVERVRREMQLHH